MSRSLVRFGGAVCGLLMATIAAAAVVSIVDFESLPLGAKYGASSGTAAGSLIFVASEIGVTVHPFSPGGGGASTYGDASIESATTGQAMRLNNVGLRFDVTKLERRPDVVTIEFSNKSTYLNIAANGGAIQTWSLASPPSVVGPGVRMFVASATLPAGGTTGTILLLGDIQNFTIGGQELVIDNVTVED